MAHVQALLPRNLAALAPLAAKGEQLRYGATTGIQLTIAEGNYTAVATDGRVLGVVTGPVGAVADYPTIPALENAPNSGTSGCIGAKEWVAAFRSLPKSRVTSSKPILADLAVILGQCEATFGSTDLATASVSNPRFLEGRFPDWTRAMPAKHSKPLVQFAVDPEYFVALLNAAKAFTDDESKRVNVTVYSPTAPIKVESCADGPKFTGLVVPLVVEQPSKPKRSRKHEVNPATLRQPWPNVFRAIARLAVVMDRSHVRAVGFAGNDDIRDHAERIGNRCNAALRALTAKYLA